MPRATKRETLMEPPAPAAASGSWDFLIPYHGRDNLKVGEPRFFCNGRKVIRVEKVERRAGDVVEHLIRRRIFATIIDKRPQGAMLRQILKKKEIPGA